MGANILLAINSVILQKVIGMILLVVLGLINLKKDVGIIQKTKSLFERTVGFTIYFLLSIFSGLFGTGTGPLITYNHMYFLGLTFTQVVATGLIPWIALAVVSLTIFTKNGIVDFGVGIPLVVGMSLGSVVGARFALNHGEASIKKLFVALVIFSSIKLLFG